MEPISRKQERICTQCGKTFWSWGMRRTKCLACDPIPPKLARIYVGQIQADDPLVRL